MSIEAPVPAAGAAGAPLLVQQEGLQGERRAARLGVGVVRDLGGLVPGGPDRPAGQMSSSQSQGNVEMNNAHSFLLGKL